MRVVDLANRLGIGVGETVEMCRRAGIDVRLGIDELRSDEIAVLSTLFKLDLVASGVDSPVGREAPLAQAAPTWAGGVEPPPMPAPPPPPPPLVSERSTSSPVAPGQWLDLDHVAPSPAATPEDESYWPDDGVDEEADRPRGDTADGTGTYATLSGRRGSRRKLRRSRGADVDQGDFSTLVDERWIPQWIRRLVAVASAVGLGVLGLVALADRQHDAELAEEREVADQVAGVCFDIVGAASVQASCLDIHDGQIISIFEYPDDTQYTDAESLGADARVRCAADPAVTAALAGAPVPVVADAVVPGQAAWEAGDRTTTCRLLRGGLLELSGSLL